MGHGQINKGRTKGDDPEIDTVQTPKHFDRRLALQEIIQKTFADSIPNTSDENLALINDKSLSKFYSIVDLNIDTFLTLFVDIEHGCHFSLNL